MIHVKVVAWRLFGTKFLKTARNHIAKTYYNIAHAVTQRFPNLPKTIKVTDLYLSQNVGDVKGEKIYAISINWIGVFTVKIF